MASSVSSSSSYSSTSSASTSPSFSSSDPPTSCLPIAVLGLACRLPGEVRDTESLWKLLSEGRNVWSPVPTERFNESSFYHPDPDSIGTTDHRGGHFISDNIASFDSSFFGIRPDEASAMDPQQRLALEVTYEAFENAGLTIGDIRGSQTAVYAAIFNRDYDRNLFKDISDLPRYITTATGDAILSNRVSYCFDFKGPSITLDTGCSGGLVALHQACMAIKNGDADTAVVIGVNLILGPDTFNGMSNLRMLNKDGRSYSFDERGAGYGRGEGVIAIVIRRMDVARASGDSFRAIIRNSGVNQDGKTSGITFPSREAQEVLQRRVYDQVGLDPKDTGYVEAHGTGTAAGDAAELQGISNVFCKNRTEPLLVGSIKSNIGHTESTSGLAGIIKAIAALEHLEVPPNADFVSPKHNLNLNRLKVKVPTVLTSWPAATLQRASVNSFGYGGTNAHVILEGPSIPDGISSLTSDDSHRPGWHLLTTSAKSKDSLEMMSQSLCTYTESRQRSSQSCEFLSYLAFTLNKRRSSFQWRKTVVVSTVEEVQEQMSKSAPNSVDIVPSTGFIFTGQGAQWPGMGRELLKSHSCFTDSIHRSDQILKDFGCPWTVSEELERPDNNSHIHESSIAQPVSTAIQIALVDLLETLGIRPSMVIGHSSGEVAAAYCAGVLSHEVALKISYARSQIPERIRKSLGVEGAMLAVGLGELAVTPFIQGFEREVRIACINSPSSVTLSGNKDAITHISEILTEQHVFNRALKVDTAYHSHHMEAGVPEYLRILSSLPTQRPEISFWSTVTGDLKTNDFGAAYWVQNLVSPVRFSDGLESFCRSQGGNTCQTWTFIEVGPHGALAGPVRQTLKGAMPQLQYSYTSALTRGRNSERTMLELVGRLWELGHDIDLQRIDLLYETRPSYKPLVDLPPYRWDHSKAHWHESRLSRAYRMRPDPPHDLLGVRIPSSTDLEPIWRHFIDRRTLPWLEDHVIDGLIIFPGSGYVCMAIEAIKQLNAAESIQSSSAQLYFVLKDIIFAKALVLPEVSQKIETQTHLSRIKRGNVTWYRFMISALSTENVWHEHCSGMISAQCKIEDATSDVYMGIDVVHTSTRQDSQVVSQTDLYERLANHGNRYGTTFSAISELSLGPNNAAGSLQIPDTQITMSAQYERPHIIHPATLDALMHPTLAIYFQTNGASSIMPASIKKLIVSTDIPSTTGHDLFVTARLQPTAVRSALASLAVYDSPCLKARKPMLSIEGLDIRGIGLTENKVETYYPGYHMTWMPDVDLLLYTASKSLMSTTNQDQDFGKLSDILRDQSKSDSLNLTVIDLLRLQLFKRPESRILLLGEEGFKDRTRENSVRNITCSHLSAINVSRECYDSVKTLFKSASGKQEDVTDLTREFKSDLAAKSFDIVIAEASVPTPIIDRFLCDNGLILTKALDNSLGANTSRTSFILRDGYVAESRSAVTLAHNRIKSINSPIKHYLSDRIDIRAFDPDSISALSLVKDVLWQKSVGHISSPRVSSVSAKDIRIIFDNGRQSVLVAPTEEQFQSITALITTSSMIIWISAPDSNVEESTPEGGLVKGLARVARAENPTLQFVTIDVTDNIVTCLETLSNLIEQILNDRYSQSQKSSERLESEYMIQNSTILIPRILEDYEVSEWIARSAGKAVFDTARYDTKDLVLKPEILVGRPQTEVIFTAERETGLPHGSIKIAASAHSLSEHDTSILLEAVPFQTPPILGVSVGTVVETSANGSRYSTGDQVCVVGGSPLANLIIKDARFVELLPDGVSTHVAAAMVPPLMDAYHSLIEIANVGQGDYVFVTSARRLIGKAAVLAALYAGAQVILAAASIEEAQRYSTQFGLPDTQIIVAQNFYDLRQTVLNCTNTQGINVLFDAPGSEYDLALSSVPLIRGASLIQRNGADKTFTSQFSSDLSIIRADLVDYAVLKPRKIPILLQKSLEMLRQCPVSFVIEAEQYSIGQINAALQAARKLSDIVIRVAPDDIVKTKSMSAPGCQLDSNATYIIAGMGDIGLGISKLLVQRGARNICLLSRRPMDATKLALLIEEASSLAGDQAIRIESIRCDISRLSDVQDVLFTIKRLSLPTVRGLLQCATVLHDATLEKMSSHDFTVPLLTKYSGTLNLRAAFQSDDLDFFVMLSSLSGVVGSRGQANYAAGNTFMDTLAQRASGTRTRYISLNLGMVLGTSAIDGQIHRKSNLERQGWLPCDFSIVISLVDYSLSSQARDSGCKQAVIGFDRESLRKAVNATPTIAGAMFTHVYPSVLTEDANTPASTKEILLKVLSNSGPDASCLALIIDFLKVKLSELILTDADNISPYTPLSDLGLDSLIAIELKNWIAKELSSAIQVSEILDAAGLQSLAKLILSRTTLSATVSNDNRAEDLHQDQEECFTEEQPVTAVRQLRDPVLPFPEISDMMAIYIATIRPFVSEEKLQEVIQQTVDFENNCGPLLLQRLKKRAKDEGTEDWAFAPYLEALYLRKRGHLQPNNTFFGNHAVGSGDITQARKAAVISQAVMIYKHDLENNRLVPDSLNGVSLSMKLLPWLFNTIREPGVGKDKLRKFEPSSHIAVLCRNNIFKLSTEDWARPEAIHEAERAFAQILAVSESSTPSIASLTGDTRDSWAVIRQELISLSEINKEIVHMVDSAAMVICLDDENPETPSEQCNQFIQGPVQNRWADKSIEFVVCANGVSGYVADHTAFDGLMVVQLNRRIDQAIKRQLTAPLSGSNRFVLQKMTPLTNTKIEGDIARVQEEIKISRYPLELMNYNLPQLRTSLLRRYGITRNAGMNLCINLASKLFYTTQIPTWESATLGAFSNGRIDRFQTVNTLAHVFCEEAATLAGGQNLEPTQAAALLATMQEVATVYTTNLIRHSRGRGFLGNMVLLEQMVDKDTEQMPAIFQDHIWKTTHNNCPRELKIDTSEGIGSNAASHFIPRRGSLFVHHQAVADASAGWVQTSDGKAHGFCEKMQQAADIIRRILEAAS